MAVSGLILSFSTASGPPATTLEALRGHPSIQVGEASDHRLPIVVETSDSDQTSMMWEWLNSLPGVTLIDLAFLHFEDDEKIRTSLERP
jgi:nitrate reductase NapAB chaperone NapD